MHRGCSIFFGTSDCGKDKSMRICGLRVQNSSRIADLDLDVGDHLVLVGPNAVGKSTLLELIDATIGASTGRLFRLFAPEALRDRAAPLIVSVQLSSLDDEAEAAFADEIDATNPDHPTLTVELRVELSAEDPAEVIPSRQMVKAGGASKPFTQRHLPFVRWSLVKASRIADRELLGASGVASRLLAGVELTDTDLAAFADAAKRYEDALGSAGGVQALRSRLKVGLEESLPQNVSDDAVQIGGMSAHEPLASAEIRLRDESGESSSLGDRSDGERALVALALQQVDHSASSMQGIDEPETHLHPRSQARIGRVLAGGSGQRIVSTHSANVAQAFAPGDVVALTATGARRLPRTVVDADPKFYGNWWVTNKIEALTASAVVLLEGPSDRLLLAAVADARGIDLDRANVVLLDLGGKQNFANAVKMLGPAGFGLPVFLLGDLDGKPSAAASFSMQQEELDPITVIVSDPDLESEYICDLGPNRIAEILQHDGRKPASSSFEDVYAKCAKRFKIQTALALGELATGLELESIGSLNELLNELIAQGFADG